jgi:hypothetical protein
MFEVRESGPSPGFARAAEMSEYSMSGEHSISEKSGEFKGIFTNWDDKF